jgi:flagella basal body P-ring formation protein FlgA
MTSPLSFLKHPRRSALAFCIAAVAGLRLAPVSAQSVVARQEPAAVRSTVEQFLHTQAAGLPGEVQVTVGQIDPRLNLPACLNPEAFLPTGSRVWGKTSVGVRCTAPSPWVVYVSAQVKVLADYLASAAPLAQGQLVGPNDIVKIRGDLTVLPAGVLTDPQQAVGRTVAMSIGLGSPLRQDSLKLQQAILQGQAVRVVSTGAGFSVATEARALNNAAAGQMAQARTAGGQVVSGIARSGGIVDVTF